MHARQLVPRGHRFALAAALVGASLTGCGSATDAPAPAPSQTAGPTYWRDVAPILAARCNECHTAGGLAPFALTAYDDVRARAAQIAAVTAAREMPPWPPAQDCRPLADARVLTAAELATLRAWSERDAPEGDRGTYVAPTPATVALPARPDVTVQPDAPYVPRADRVDDYHCFVMDPHLTETRDLVGAWIHPGEARTVHHVILYEVLTAGLPDLARVDEREPGPGYTCYGGAGIPQGSLTNPKVKMIAGWAPGGPPFRAPRDTAVRLSPGSRIVMQMHYNQLNGRGLPDRTSVDLYYSPTQVSRPAYLVPLAQTSFTLAPGDADATVTNEIALRRFNVPFSVTVHGTAPHMHTLGRSIRVDRTTMAGERDCLVDIPRWNFHWQQGYMFETPMRVAPDDTLRITCRFDNSAANQQVVDGVSQPPREVHWGEGTLDEMCLNFLYLTIP